MVFSKSFGYAIRGILYVIIKGKPGQKIQLDEIADTLNVPRYFLGKVLKKVAKEGFLNSAKGHSGGFSVNEKTLSVSLIEIARLVGELNEIERCVLKFRTCSSSNPCPLHTKIEPVRTQWESFLMNTRVGDLIDTRSAAFMDSLVSD